MLQILLNNKFRIVQLVFLVGLFAIIRAFENELFYDPFLIFFKENSASVYPNYDSIKLYWGLFFRYSLNSMISLGILYVIFKDLNLLKFSAILYFIFFIILIVGFSIYLNYFDESHRMILFYIRRFIIQPIFVLLFIPGFYFQMQSR